MDSLRAAAVLFAGMVARLPMLRVWLVFLMWASY
jgi:hypothetical protein